MLKEHMPREPMLKDRSGYGEGNCVCPEFLVGDIHSFSPSVPTIPEMRVSVNG